MTDIGLSQEQIDAMLGGGAAPDAGAAASDDAGGLSGADASALTDFERETLGNLPNVLNAMTGFDYTLGALEVSQTNPAELPDLLGNDLVFRFPVDVNGEETHFLVFEPAVAKKIAAALTGGDAEGDPELNEMEMSAITEVVSQANGSYLTSLSSALKSTAKGEAVEKIDVPVLAAEANNNTLITNLTLESDESEATTVWHVVLSGLADKILEKIRPPEKAPPEPKPAPAQSAAPAAQKPAPAQGGAAPISSGNVVADSTEYVGAQFSDLPEITVDADVRNLDILMDVPLTITVELGKTMMPIRKILEYAQGSLITLDKLAGEPIDLLVNGKYFAKGEVVVIDENFGVRITSILSPAERLSQLG